jgi:tape measure domain-containing protein
VAINLGGIFFGIGANTSQLQQAATNVSQFTAQINAATQAAATFANQAARATAAANQLAAAQRNTQAMRQPGGPLFNQQQGRGTGNLPNMFPGAAAVNPQMQTTVELLRQLASTASLVAGPLSGVASRFATLAALSNQFSVSLAGTLAGVAAGVYTMYSFARATIEVARNLQQIEWTLGGVTGDTTIASTEMKYLADFSLKAGARITDVAKSYAQMLAASKGTNLEGERTRMIFEAITMTGAKLALSQGDIEGALRAVQQIMSKGTVQAEELRSQLGDRMPGAMSIMADALGVTTIKLDTMMKKGEVGRSTLVKFAETLKQRFGVDTSQRVDSITNAEQRLYTARVILIDQLDKQIGLSSVYQGMLNKLSDTLIWISDNTGKLAAILGVAGGAMVGFATPAIASALGAIAGGVLTLTARFIGLNAAMLANPITGFLGLLSRLTAGLLGASAGYALMKKVVDETTQSHLKALPPVEDYIKAQKDLKSSIRATTEEYITQVKALVASSTTEYQKATQTLRQVSQEMAKIAAADIPSSDKKEMLARYNAEIALLEQKMRDAGLETARLNKILTELDDILKRQTEAEGRNRSDPTKDLTNRQTLAIKNAQDTIRELEQTYAALFKAPALKETMLLQVEMNKQIENFRDVLTRAELPAEKVAELTGKFAENLKKVKEGELSLTRLTSVFQAMEGVFSRGLDKAADAWVQSIIEGKNAMQELGKVGQAVLADLIKTMMQLAILNPLKNALFGTNYAELGGTAGAGGILGSLFGFAGGGVMSGGGPIQLARYASGGIADRPQMAMFGEGSHNEAYVPLPDGRSIPVTMKGGGNGGNNVVININTEKGMKAETRRSTNSGGMDVYDIVVTNVNKGWVNGDLADVQSYGRQRRR